MLIGLYLKKTDKTDTIYTDLWVYNERDYLIHIKLIEHSRQYIPQIKWINEKLIYVQLWWGRIVGAYFIFDVERESIIIKEMINDGQIPFQQWNERGN